MLSRTMPTDSSCYNDSEKVKFDLSTTYPFVVIEGKVKGQIFGSTGVKQVNVNPMLLAIVSKCSFSKYNDKSE